MADRAQPTTSSARQVAAVQNAEITHGWPDEAGTCTVETWAIYTKNQCFRSFDDWNDAELFELARVSRLQAMAVEEMNELETEGLIVYGGKTGMVPMENPRNRAIGSLNSTITSTLRRLGITASNSGGDREAKAKRGQQERNARGVITQGGENERSGTSLM